MSDSEILKFSEILSSRLCHDLITPVGAISTGLELLHEQEDPKSEETEEIWALIQQSARTASNRLGFYRIAFGSSGTNLTLGDSKHLIEKYYEKGKLEFQWPEAFDPHFSPPRWGRLLINTVMWTAECAPRGGKIFISPPTQESESLEVSLETPHIIYHEGSREALRGELELPELTPRTVQASLIRLLVQRLGRQLTLDDNHPERVSVNVS